jgi:hypothetical protein
LAAALDLTYEASYEWTGSYFYEELHGIADGKRPFPHSVVSEGRKSLTVI